MVATTGTVGATVGATVVGVVGSGVADAAPARSTTPASGVGTVAASVRSELAMLCARASVVRHAAAPREPARSRLNGRRGVRTRPRDHPAGSPADASLALACAATSDGCRQVRSDGSGGGPPTKGSKSSSLTAGDHTTHAVIGRRGSRITDGRTCPVSRNARYHNRLSLRTMVVVIAPNGDNWTGIVDGPLPLDEAASWVVLPSCGAAVFFSGTARDHSTGRPEVDRLEYEAYEEQVSPRLDAIVAAARRQWSDIGRMALLHRIGYVPVTESAVIVAVSSPHRATSFEAARFGIDTLKNTVPIWKKERWQGGESWGLEPQHVEEVGDTHPASPA